MTEREIRDDERRRVADLIDEYAADVGRWMIDTETVVRMLAHLIATDRVPTIRTGEMLSSI